MSLGPFMVPAALLWMHSSLSKSFIKYDSQNCTQFFQLASAV